MNMSEAHSMDTTGMTVVERLERIEDRLQGVEIVATEAKGIALEARSVARVAQERALLAFGHAETDPDLPQVDPHEAHEEYKALGRDPEQDNVDPIATYDEVVALAERHGAHVLDDDTYDNIVATLSGVRDAMDLAVGAMGKRRA